MESIMTKLPEKNVLTGNKLPKTTTGEMKRALGELHDYLSELLGESADKEMTRQTLGIEEAVGMATRNKVTKQSWTTVYTCLKKKS